MYEDLLGPRPDKPDKPKEPKEEEEIDLEMAEEAKDEGRPVPEGDPPKDDPWEDVADDLDLEDLEDMDDCDGDCDGCDLDCAADDEDPEGC